MLPVEKQHNRLSLFLINFIMLNKLSFILLLAITTHVAKGQKLLEFKSYDTTAYVYTLDKEQMDFIAEHNTIFDTTFLFTHLYKKFPRNSNYSASLPYGNYIIATIDQANVNYNYVYLSSFEIKHKVIGNDVILFVKDKTSRKNISTATVKLNNVLIPFNEGYGGYTLDKNSVNAKLLAINKAFLNVSLGEEYCVMRYNFLNGYQGSVAGTKSRFTNQTLASSGYLINDKPLYRLGDTLRVKAFLTNPLTGRPFKCRAVFTINEPAQNFMFSKKLKPVTPGAFVFDWCIPDTLKIDRSFQMNFTYKVRSNRFVKSSSFYLENYVLNANQYEAFMVKEEFYPGEDISFRVQASDANRFPLQGTMIHYKLSLNNVQDFYGDTLLLSEAKRLNFFEKDTVYPYETAMDLKIPSTLFPNMDASYGIDVTLTDPNTFEQKSLRLNCNRVMKKEKLLVYQTADSLFVRFLFNGKDTASSYQLVSLSNGDTLFKKNITTPQSFQLSPYNTQVVLMDKQKMVTSLNIFFNGLDISKVKGERSADSIRIAFSFPFDEAIYYRILKKDKVVQQGKTKKLDFKIADNTKDSYTLLFTSNINNSIETNFYRITYVPPIHKIKLRSNLPKQAFPGQKVLVNVVATDCYNKPLKKINIAAYAVNKQFEERFETPEITVPEPFKDLVTIQEEASADQVMLYLPNVQIQSPLTSKNFSQFDLYNNEYYQLRYPRGTHTVLSKNIQSPIPEFAISVTNNHIAYTPKYILLDGQPVYISDLQVSPYSFQTKEGTHQITFRFFDKKITLNNVSFEASKKYWLGFNMDSIKKSTPNLVIVDSLPVVQPNESEKNILYNTLLLTNQFPYDSLFFKSNDALVLASNKSIRRQPKSFMIDGDYFYVFGPLNENSTTIQVNKKTFNLKVSSEYAHYFDPTTQQFTSKNRGPVKGAIFGFTEAQLSDYQLATMHVYDTVIPQPEKVNVVYNPEANHAIHNKQEPEYTQRYNSGGPNQFSIWFKNNEKSSYVKALWIINKKQPEQSEFSQIVNRSALYPFFKNGNEGAYDLYFLMNDQKMVVLRDYSFKNQDALYINPSLLTSEELNNEKLALPLKIYSDLTKLPLLPFYFPPEESNEKIKETHDVNRQKTYLHGYITNESLQPLANVMVFAEVNGKFMHGAVTNNVGEYEILDMLPGTYQLKFYHSSYQIKTFVSRFLKQGYSYELNTSLKNVSLQKPVLETIQKDFRFMAFNGNKRENLMKLNLYDKETREALHGFTLTLQEEISDVAEKVIQAKEDLELAFPSQAKVYKLEIACKGYVPVVFHNIRFCKNSFYALYLFMISEKENPLIKKKEYNLQMQNYPAEGEIGTFLTNASYVQNYNNFASGSNASSYISREDYQNLSTMEIQTLSKKRNYNNVPSPQGMPDVKSFADENTALEEVQLVTSNANENNYASDDMINQVVNNSSLNTTRKNFSDVGYWQPNHLTDKKGSVSFEIRLPDNITTWKSNILAMGKCHLHGIDTSEMRTYKPLQVSSIIPPFLWIGDKVWAKAKFTNLTKDSKNITASMMINGNLLRKSEALVKNDYVDSMLLEAKLPQSLQFKASLQYQENYKDEEQRDITVYNPAFRFYTNRNFNMEKDSTYHLKFKDGTKGEIILNNNLYEKIVEEINELGKYEYTCVEQTSSQLKALLCKEKINRALQSKENLNVKIYRLLHQLENYQNKNGTWGWWKRQSVNWRMTIYATEAMGKANSSGYNSNSFAKGINAIKDNFTSLSVSDQLYGYSVMQQFGRKDASIKKIIEKIKVETLAPIDKMYYYKIKEVEGETIDPNVLYTVYLEMNNQLFRPYYGDFFYEPRANLLSAYNLFSNSSLGKEWLQLFKSKLSNGTLDHNLNTYSKVTLIEVLTASAENTDNKPVTAQVIINDTLKVKTFPYRLSIARTSYKLNHSDASVFVNTAEENYTDKPENSDSLFKVSTSFVQKGQKKSELQAGVVCQMNIAVDAYRSFDYVMIEIPIPSGMRFVTKTQQSGCTIEYFKNKVVIFYERLNMQQHQLSFDMIPAFRGDFIWPAAKCSLMYYPYLFGNNQTQSIEIK
jgi:hypothetical protein